MDATTRKVGRSSFTMGYRIWSAAQEAEVATGEDVIVTVDYRSGRTTIVDEPLRAAILALEATAASSPAG